MVRKERLELSHLAALEPKSSASTNFATSAKQPQIIQKSQVVAKPVAQPYQDGCVLALAGVSWRYLASIDVQGRIYVDQ
tara:strand:+ start:17778 stop:18014 length:237 start_codon:yes stop_codon:yes gene_type:complete